MKKIILTMTVLATALLVTGCTDAEAKAEAPLGEPYMAYSNKYEYCTNFGVDLYSICLEDMDKRGLFRN